MQILNHLIADSTAYGAHVGRDKYQYDVALSFAGEQRKYVEAVAESLVDTGTKIFYDDYEKVSLWGKDLYTHLDYVYRKASRFCIVFISAAYASKVWTNHERRSAQARAIQENTEYLLPARFDQTELPGLPPTIGYLDLNEVAPQELAVMILEKLGPRIVEPGFPSKPDRLLDDLRIKGTGAKAKKIKKETTRVARSFYDALERMTIEERTAVAGVFAFGCIGELPDGVHVSLDYLSRMTRMPKAELLEALRSVRSLNFKTIVRDQPRDPAHRVGELLGDDQDLLLSFWSQAVPASRDSTRVAQAAVNAAASHYCADHGLDVVRRLDFRRLSTAYTGAVILEREDGDAADVEVHAPRSDG